MRQMPLCLVTVSFAAWPPIVAADPDPNYL
jgi:hypothetical protein